MTINPDPSPKPESLHVSAFASTAQSNVRSPETVRSPESVRDAFSSAFDVSPKSPPESTGETIQIEMFLVRKLRTFQVQVNIYIRAYLVFVDLQKQCEDAQMYVEQVHSDLPNLRQKAWYQIRDVFERRPEGLDDLLKDLNVEMAKLRDLITGDSSPLYSEGAGNQSFYHQVSKSLTHVIEKVASLRGDFQRFSLEALQNLSNHVESIFSRSEEAREASRPFGATGADFPLVSVRPAAFRMADEANQGRTPLEFGRPST